MVATKSPSTTRKGSAWAQLPPEERKRRIDEKLALYPDATPDEKRCLMGDTVMDYLIELDKASSTSSPTR